MLPKYSFIILTFILLSGMVVGCNETISQPKPVKIALSLWRSDSFGKGIENAVQLALKKVNNKAGNVPVELLIYDIQDPKYAPDGDILGGEAEIRRVKEFIDDPSVVAYLGSLSSNLTKASLPVLNQAGIPQISPSASWPGLTKSGYSPGEPGVYYPTGKRHFFRTSPTDDAQGAAAARWAKELALNKVYLLHDKATTSMGLTGIFELTAQDIGLEIVGKDNFDTEHWSAEQVQQIANRVAASKANLLYYSPAGGSETTTEFIKAVKALVPDIKIMGGDTVAGTMIDTLPAEVLEGFMATELGGVPSQLEGQAAVDLATQYKAAYGEELTSALATASYEATGAILKAIATAKEPTRAEVLAQLRQLEYTGVFGTWHFDENGDISAKIITGRQVKNNNWQTVRILQ